MIDFVNAAKRIADRNARLALKQYVTIIAGSRGLHGMCDEDLVDLAVTRSGFNVIKVLSGGARGLDNAGEKWAVKRGLPVEQYPPDWAVDGKGAGYIRNERMSVNGEALIAVWDCKSKGTAHMIRRMQELEKPCFVLEVQVFWVKAQWSYTEVLVVTELDGRIIWSPGAHAHCLIGSNIEGLAGVESIKQA